MRVLFFLFIVMILYSCSEGNKKTPVEKNKVLLQPKTQKEISVKKIGELRFRMTYVIEGKVLSLNQLKKIDEDKQTYYYAANPDTALLKKFQDLGLVNINELLLRKFKSLKTMDLDHPNAEFVLKDPGINKLVCKLIRNDSNSHYTFSVSDSLRSTQIILDGFYVEGLKFMLFDIMPGGFKELVILNQYYIANGENSDIFIYEIKYTH